MQRSRTTLYNPKLNLNPHSRNTLFYTKKMFKKGIIGMKILYKTPLGETGCSGKHFLFTGCLSIQFFDSPPFSQHSRLGCLWLPTSDCAAPVWLTRCHATPLVAKCFSPNPYLGKQRISLGVAIILSMYLCPHT